MGGGGGVVVRVGDVGSSDRAHVRALAERRVDDVELGDTRGADEGEGARGGALGEGHDEFARARALGLAKERGGGRGRGVGDRRSNAPSSDVGRTTTRARRSAAPSASAEGHEHVGGSKFMTRAARSELPRARRVGGQTRHSTSACVRALSRKMTFRRIRARAAQRWPRAAATGAAESSTRPSSLRTFRDRVVQPFTRVDPRARPTRRALRVVRISRPWRRRTHRTTSAFGAS